MSVAREPVWHRLARDMAREGATADQIADEFGCSVDDAEALFDARRDARTAKANAERAAERMRRLNADPAYKARVGRPPSWCPPERLREYRDLSVIHGRAEARRIIEASLHPSSAVPVPVPVPVRACQGHGQESTAWTAGSSIGSGQP